MGRDKWSLPFGSESLLQRSVRILSEVVSPVIVVAADSQKIVGLPQDIEIVRDRISDRGPLAGIQAGLAALAESANSITLRQADGANVPLQRSDIMRMRSAGISFMPEGLEKEIDIAAMADLLSYLSEQ